MVDLFGKDKGNISLPRRLQASQNDENGKEKKVSILNMQKAMYNVLIGDTLKRIERLQGKNAELIADCRANELLYERTDIETSKQIAQLNRSLSVKTENMTQNMQRLEDIEKLRTEEKNIHLEKVNHINENYATTHRMLTSQLKIINSKINSLEEYKVMEDKLIEKFNTGNDLLVQQEKKVKEGLNQMDLKFKVDRDKIQKDLYHRLLRLAGLFQTDTAHIIAGPVHRLILENIIIKQELSNIADDMTITMGRANN